MRTSVVQTKSSAKYFALRERYRSNLKSLSFCAEGGATIYFERQIRPHVEMNRNEST